MSEEKKYEGVSPKGDFEKALRYMLLCYDALEEENIPIDEYPHYDFAKYSVERVRALKDEKILPVTFMHIPFEMAQGKRQYVNEDNVKPKYQRYVDLLIEQYELSSQEQISIKIGKKSLGETKTVLELKRHLELYKELKGKKVYDLPTYTGWRGWNPRKWEIEAENLQTIAVKDLEQIGKEFEFSYAMARLASLCEAQKNEAPFKEKWVLYFWGLVNANEVYQGNNHDVELENLKQFLKQDYKAIFSLDRELNVDYLKECIKYFNPYCLTLEEMNKYFICSIILCKENKEKPEQVFFRQVCLLGRLNKIHCFPIRFIESESESDQENLRVKIKGLKEIVLDKKIIFPDKGKIKTIEDDWARRVSFLGAKIPFKILFPIICNLFGLDQQYENRKTTGNQEQMEKNKKLIEEAKTSHVILDWITYPLRSATDRKHRFFDLIIALICLYSRNPQRCNEILNSMGENIFPQLTSASEEPEKRLALIERVNEGVIPEIISFIGMLERFACPIRLDREIEYSDLLRIESCSRFLENKENSSVMNFRAEAVLGLVFKHSVIVKFITIEDFKKNMAWLEDLRAVVPKVVPLLLRGAMKVAGSKISSEIRDLFYKTLNEPSLDLLALLQEFARVQNDSMQSGKINLENCNPEKPIS